MLVISDTSPLILLDKIGHLWILGKLFDKVIIPPAVHSEWLRPGGYITPEWLSVVLLSPDAENTARDLATKMDRGEAEAIALYTVHKTDFVLLDDLHGRKIAKSMDIPIVGTLGIITAAKQRGIIKDMKTVLDALQNNRFYITDEALRKALELAGEV
jgi:predicted nucleic acid-binding protein